MGMSGEGMMERGRLQQLLYFHFQSRGVVNVPTPLDGCVRASVENLICDDQIDCMVALCFA